MGYPMKIQLISRKKEGCQWYVNFPNALAQAMQFRKGETIEWEVVSIHCLTMKRSSVISSGCTKSRRIPKKR